MDYKKTRAPHTTVTRDMNKLSDEVGNLYETVVVLGKRANQIGTALKKELDNKLQDFSVPQDGIDEVFENKEQIEISKSYERLPKPSLIATQELVDHQLVIRNNSRDAALNQA